jgi:hypothetical protein
MITVLTFPNEARAKSAKRQFVDAQTLIDHVIVAANPDIELPDPDDTYHVFREIDGVWVLGCDDPSLPVAEPEEECGL